MAVETRVALEVAGAMADQVTAALDSGTADGILVIFDGTSPTECEDADVGTVLAVFPLGSPAFPGYTDLDPGARVAANYINSVAPVASGTARYFRAYSCNTSQIYENRVTCYVQGAVGLVSADLIVDDINVIRGRTLSVTSWVLDLPVVGADIDAAAFFILTFRTTTSNESITLPLMEYAYTYDGYSVTPAVHTFTVNWGDDSSDIISAWDQVETTHEYAVAGDYTVVIDGITEVWDFYNQDASALQIIEIAQWGNNPWTAFFEAFYGCTGLTVTAIDAPNLTSVDDCSYMFQGCGATFVMNDVGAAAWQTGTLKTAVFMFDGCTSFNSTIGDWDMTGMDDAIAGGPSNMLNGCTAFDQDLNWQFDSLTGAGLTSILYGASAFNSSVAGVSLGGATSLLSMFENCAAFTGQGLDAIDYSNVTVATLFCAGAAVSTGNYDDLLAALAVQTLQPNVPLDMGTTQYSAAAVADRAVLTGAPNNWTITDGGLEP